MSGLSGSSGKSGGTGSGSSNVGLCCVSLTFIGGSDGDGVYVPSPGGSVWMNGNGWTIEKVPSGGGFYYAVFDSGHVGFAISSTTAGPTSCPADADWTFAGATISIVDCPPAGSSLSSGGSRGSCDNCGFFISPSGTLVTTGYTMPDPVTLGAGGGHSYSATYFTYDITLIKVGCEWRYQIRIGGDLMFDVPKVQCDPYGTYTGGFGIAGVQSFTVSPG